jgi:hypothetical protein
VPVPGARQGHPELADIFRTHGHRLDGLSAQQRRVVAAITSCRTAALGGHVRECDRGCGYQEISYNSCRDRHCPKCQGLERVRWQEARADDLLPVPYFHLVFTIPSSLHEIFLAHPQVAYNLLFAAVADTVKEVAANPKNLGALIGMTAVLHTWTQTLLYHPHLHLIVPGGGVDPTGSRWIPGRPNFFLPVDILGRVFRGKLLDALEKALASGKIKTSVGRGVPVATLLHRAARPRWVVYAKPPFAGPEQVLAYLGRYTHRIAISNDRLVSVEDDQVTFHYRDRTDGNRRKSMTLSAVTFLRRFLLHVLPPGFVRIRHYGLLANSVRRERIALCRRLLGVPTETAPPTHTQSWEELLLRLTGKDVTRCPQCKAGHLHTTHEIRADRSQRPIRCRGDPP